jgi:hypothetical protein
MVSKGFLEQEGKMDYERGSGEEGNQSQVKG